LSNRRIRNPKRCHPEAAESLAKPRTPNEGSMYFADITINEGYPIFRALCERWERRTPRDTNSIVLPTSTLSSRAQKDRPLADDLAESRDLLSADTRHQSPCDKSVARTNSRSFDSGSKLASESAPSAQDDNFEKRKATNGRPHLRMSCRMAAFAPETLSSRGSGVLGKAKDPQRRIYVLCRAPP
jgi:hypothetical protein